MNRLVQPSGRWLHGLAILWIVVLAGATLTPAFAHGWRIGTYDLLAHSSLTSRAGVIENGSYINSDPIVQMIPWTALAWTQVHHGILPLWNPYNGLGLPLAFNWQSAPFGIASLIGYLFPADYAYTAAVVATLIIAGAGGYVLGRILRLGLLGAVMVATVFELSGPLIAWLGYPQAQVMSWGGWLFAAGILVVRGNRRVPAITLFAVVLACAIYAGHPETLIVFVGGTGVFLITLLVFRSLPSRFGFDSGPICRPVINLAIATVAGVALAAPLLLPALQLTGTSVRATSTGSPTAPVHDMLYLVFSGFDGVPVAGNYGFGGSFFYDETSTYVGAIAVVLASVAVVTGIRHRRPEVLASAAVVLVMAALAYLPPATHLADRMPLIGEVNWALRPYAPMPGPCHPGRRRVGRGGQVAEISNHPGIAPGWIRDCRRVARRPVDFRSRRRTSELGPLLGCARSSGELLVADDRRGGWRRWGCAFVLAVPRGPCGGIVVVSLRSDLPRRCRLNPDCLEHQWLRPHPCCSCTTTCRG